MPCLDFLIGERAILAARPPGTTTSNREEFGTLASVLALGVESILNRCLEYATMTCLVRVIVDRNGLWYDCG